MIGHIRSTPQFSDFLAAPELSKSLIVLDKFPVFFLNATCLLLSVSLSLDNIIMITTLWHLIKANFFFVHSDIHLKWRLTAKTAQYLLKGLPHFQAAAGVDEGVNHRVAHNEDQVHGEV